MNQMDLFTTSHKPKDLAISRVIDEAVERFIADDLEEADRFFDLAEEFINAPAERFAPTIT